MRVLSGSGAGLRRGDLDRNDRAVLPEALERVVHTVFLVEDVHHDIAEIEKGPPTLGESFTTQDLDTLLGETVDDLLTDGHDIALVAAGGEEEDVGKRKRTGHVEGDEIGCLLRIGGGGRDLGELDGAC